MKKITSTILSTLTLTGSFVLIGMELASALSFTTTLTPSDLSYSLNNLTVGKVVYNWETDETSGIIESDQVKNLTLNLFDGSDHLLFTDVMIVDNVAQYIGNVTRELDAIIWEFDLDNGILLDFDNDYYTLRAGSTGTIYNIFGHHDNSDMFFKVVQYNDENFVAEAIYDSLNQNTQEVPEPVTILGTLLAGSLGIAFKKKQAA